MNIRTLTAAALLVAGFHGAVQAQARIPRWHENLATATAQSRISGKPVFIVFRCVR
jgi:hypothetical protein